MSNNFLFLLFICIHAFSNTSGYPEFLLSPGTEQKIPYRLLEIFTRTTFSFKRLNVEARELLYEVLGGDNLIGPSLNISLRAVTKPLNTDFSISYESNGRQRAESLVEIFRRQGSGYTVVYNRKSKKVLNVWGNNIYLKALDTDAFPNVFVNIHDSLKLNEEISKESKGLQQRSKQPDVSERENISVRQVVTCASGGVHTVELAIAYDNSFCALHSNSEAIASAYVQAAVNEASFVFMRDSCVSFSLAHIEAHCEDPSDPYTFLSTPLPIASPAPSLQILQGFSSIWGNSRTNVHRDLAYFFSGFEDGTNVLGVAYMAATCRNVGYGWVEKGDISTLVHELGHSLSVEHTSEGVMQPSLVQGDPVFFSATSVGEITNFIDNYGSNGAPTKYLDSQCLEVSTPICDASCPGKCLGGECVALYKESMPDEIVPCTPIQLIFRCTTIHPSGYTFGTDCPDWFDFVLRSEPDMDVFCCLAPEETMTARIISFEYPFLKMLLTYLGVTQIYPEYIQDTSIITEETLMVTKMLPSCTVPRYQNHSSPPSYSPIPSVSLSVLPSMYSTSEPSVSPSPIAFAIPTVSESESPTPLSPLASPLVPMSSPYTTSPTITSFPEVSASVFPMTSQIPLTPNLLTCKDTFSSQKTFRCAKRVVIEAKSRIRNAQIKIVVIQRSGLFQLKAMVGRRLKIHEMAGLISTTAGLTVEELGTVVSYEPTGVPESSIETSAFDLKVPEGNTTCCGKKMFLYVSLKVCSSYNESMCSMTGLLTGSAVMRCHRPCRKSNSGTIVPFSSSVECPTCLLEA